MKKVYCKDCRKYIESYQRQIINAGDLCLVKTSNYYDRKEYSIPSKKNKNNNCKDFEAK